MASDPRRILLWQHYDVRDNARHDLVFTLRTLNRESLATAAYDLSEKFVQLVMSWGTATNASTAHQTTAVGSSATADAPFYVSDATAGEITWTPTATNQLQQANSPYYFHITDSSTSDYSDDTKDWPEGHMGIIRVSD